MREIRDDVRRWLDEGLEVSLAQVTKTWGSSPRVPGSVMAVSVDGRMAGSVSGGCIEGAVAQVAIECADGHLSSLEKFHASTRRAQEVGLSCGGNIEVFVSRLDPASFALEEALLAADVDYVRVTAVEALPEPASACDGSGDPSRAGAVAGESDARLVGTSFLVAEEAALRKAASEAADRLTCSSLSIAPLGDGPCALAALEGVDPAVLEAVAAQVAERPRSESTGHVIEGGFDWFFARVQAKPQLVCIGGVHIAMRLCEIAHSLGYRTVVVDPRRVFATDERFPGVDELVHGWPQEVFGPEGVVRLTAQTAVCALTHDPKIDVPALVAALESPAFYIGSLGRTTTQLARYRALREEGCKDEAIARIYGPIGLDLRGREPAEIALSVMAEITGVRHGCPYPLSTMAETAQRLLAEKAERE